jgi:hypothetical protein
MLRFTHCIVDTVLETETAVITATDFTTVYTIPAATVVPLAPRDHRLPNPIMARQKIGKPSNVPTYASACSGTVRYSSACSCIGISQETTTVAVCIFPSKSLIYPDIYLSNCLL